MNQNSFSCQTNEDGEPIAQIPWAFINIATGEVNRDRPEFNTAAYSTNLVEFGILSVLSNDTRYYRAAKDIVQQFMDLSSDLHLPGRTFDVMTKDKTDLRQVWTDPSSHICAGIDSYFEYMIKCYKLFGDQDCLDWWDISYPAILEYMGNYTEDDVDQERLWFKRVYIEDASDSWDVGHYDLHAHFFASVVALSGEMETAKKNQEANHYMWSVKNSKVTPFNYDFLKDEIVHAYWNLNPEIMESNYYLYAMTGEQIYYDRALEYLEDIMNVSRCWDESICVGYSALYNVSASNIVRKPECQSFFYAETYKYLYLTFLANTTNGSDVFDFDDYIFNTEAQPLPKEWGETLLDMDFSNATLPENYNNCPSPSDGSMDFNEFWILTNIYGASFVIWLLCFYLLVILLFVIRKTYRAAYTTVVFHGSGDTSAEKAKLHKVCYAFMDLCIISIFCCNFHYVFSKLTRLWIGIIMKIAQDGILLNGVLSHQSHFIYILKYVFYFLHTNLIDLCGIQTLLDSIFFNHNLMRCFAGCLFKVKFV